MERPTGVLFLLCFPLPHIGPKARWFRENLERARVLNSSVPLDHDLRTLRDAEDLCEEYSVHMQWDEFHRCVRMRYTCKIFFGVHVLQIAGMCV